MSLQSVEGLSVGKQSRHVYLWQVGLPASAQSRPRGYSYKRLTCNGARAKLQDLQHPAVLWLACVRHRNVVLYCHRSGTGSGVSYQKEKAGGGNGGLHGSVSSETQAANGKTDSRDCSGLLSDCRKGVLV